MSKLGVAMVGLDHWYTAFSCLPQIVKSESAKLVVIAHDDKAKVEKAGQEYGGVETTTDYRAALNRSDVDIVVALASTEQNVALCKEAAALGKHIISVKPMAMDLASADELVAAIKAAGVNFFPLESQKRLSPEIQRQKAWIDEGRFGSPLRYNHVLNGSLPQAWPGVTDSSGWWVDPSRVPGGGWLDHAIYAIDTARWFFNSEITSVSGVAGNKRHADLPVEDYGLAVYEFANGTVASVEDTWTSDPGYSFSSNELIGTRGVLREDAFSGKLTVKGDFGYDGWVSLEALRKPYDFVQHMVDVVRGEAKLIANEDDGRANLAACLAFYKAAKNQTVEKL